MTALDSFTLLIKPSNELCATLATPSNPNRRTLKLRVLKMGPFNPDHSKASSVANEVLEFPFQSFVSANSPALVERTIRFPANTRSEFMMLIGVQNESDPTSLIWQQTGFLSNLTDKPPCVGLIVDMVGSEIKANYRFLGPSEEREFRTLELRKADRCSVM